MKRFLVLALAAFAFAACSEKEETGNQPAQNAELEQSYVAVTFTADDVTRAENGNEYEEGTDAERAVKFAHIFFFQNGKAFHVQFDNTTTTHAGPNNYIKIALEGSTEDMDNVSDIKDKVLVIQNYKGEYPNQIVAVLNWNPTKSDYTLSELQTEIVGLGNDEKGYIMSNAVYADKANTVVDAVRLTEANIGKTADEAKANPVTIHVERVAAKVVYSAEKDGKFDTGKEINGVKIYAQIENFELYNDYQTSYLIKRINPNWADDANFGFTNWNDVDWFRSYWATSLDTAFPDNSFDWNNDNTALNGINYLGENTRSGEANRTKVIIKAKLVNEAGNPVEVVNWYGKDYVGENELKIVVANTLKYTYFTSIDDGKTFIGITPEDIKCVARDPEMENAFEVYFQLDDSVMEKRWYKFDSKESNYVLYSSNEELNKELKMTVQPALVYNDGMTYYWLDIKHLGLKDSTTEYGIVRNHVYKVNITDIKGYGTPIYDPTQDFIIPDKPEDIVTYVSAQINILSWRVVENDYEVK
ncbi:MAG: Mfa1 fimbrilin C-terminal domain-containing protein [Alistipes sp.]|nr:Mfa1 fimbrilin C-terminal domain-containing protein [Alistipes sp.]